MVRRKRLPDLLSVHGPMEWERFRKTDRSIRSAAATKSVMPVGMIGQQLNVRNLVIGKERSSGMPAAGRQAAEAVGKPTGQSS